MTGVGFKPRTSRPIKKEKGKYNIIKLKHKKKLLKMNSFLFILIELKQENNQFPTKKKGKKKREENQFQNN